MLQRNPVLASLVKSIYVNLSKAPESDLARTTVWSIARPPLLPNCTELDIEPGMDHYGELTMPITEILGWASNVHS
jgi:hypothetical protein